MRYLKSILMIGVVLIIPAFYGCQSTPKKGGKNYVLAVTPEEVKYPESEVLLSPGDVIEIRFFYTPELNTIQTIRPDGKISLQLIGEMTAQGKTPSALKDDLTKSFSKLIKQIDVAVIVQSFGNRRVYVGGSVRTPGSFPIVDRLTVLEAIMLAGGIDPQSGKYKNVIVIQYRDGSWTGGKVDLTNLLRGEKTEPVYLKPQDIVFVPETSIVKVQRWLNQHIGTILPQIGFTYNANPYNPNTFGIEANYSLGQ